MLYTGHPLRSCFGTVAVAVGIRSCGGLQALFPRLGLLDDLPAVGALLGPGCVRNRDASGDTKTARALRYRLCLIDLRSYLDVVEICARATGAFSSRLRWRFLFGTTRVCQIAGTHVTCASETTTATYGARSMAVIHSGTSQPEVRITLAMLHARFFERAVLRKCDERNLGPRLMPLRRSVSWTYLRTYGASSSVNIVTASPGRPARPARPGLLRGGMSWRLWTGRDLGRVRIRTGGDLGRVGIRTGGD